VKSGHRGQAINRLRGIVIGRVPRLPIATSRTRQAVRAAAAALVVAGVMVALPADADTGSCGDGSNAIACENSKAGNGWQDWDIRGAGDSEIQGYATDISVNVGGTIGFKIDTAASSYSVDIYRIGYYGGKGARKITSPAVTILRQGNQHQGDHPCVLSQATGLYDCGAWALSATWAVPANAVSGVYVAKLTTNLGDSSHITFVVRNDASRSEIVVKTSDATWQAYNTYGGANFYPGGTGPGSDGRAYKLSYNRPFGTRGDNAGRDFFFSAEYPMVQFLEANGYDVSYTTDVDADRNGQLLKNHKVFMSVGHDEYWSGAERANVEAARDAGVSLAFFSGNEVYWKTRWESSVDGSNTSYRTLVCYKETWANAKIDPSAEWTGTWRDPRLTPPANGSRPENALTGTLYLANHDDLALVVPADQGKYRIWRGTTVAQQTSGSMTLAEHTIGYESDEDVDNGYRPAGLIRMSTTVGTTPQLLQDFGNVVAPGTTTHSITLYRAPSGALVFSAGTIQWAWALADEHDGVEFLTDTRIQQATVNVLADMGAQPTTLLSTLQAVSASIDHQAPTTTITSPAAGTTVRSGQQVRVTGTAADAGGGRVAGVEVSTDGGTTWHPATGTTSWSYTTYATGVNTQTILARATDDSANMATTPASVQLTVKGPYTIFGDRTPATPAVDDSHGVELGVKFQPQSDGYVTGVRFYKGAGNTGTHTGSLWTAGGTRVATGNFANETASGWQTMTFSSPVAVSRGTTYVASYYAPNGHYSADAWQFSYRAFQAPPLSANRSLGSDSNGLFKYGGGFPNESYGDSNYYVDVTYLDSEAGAPAVVSVSPAAGSTNVPTQSKVSVKFSKSMSPSAIQLTVKDGSGAAVAGSVSYDDSTRTASFTPSPALPIAQTFTATASGTDTAGHSTDAPTTWSFTTDQYAQVLSLFGADATPANPSVNDRNGVSLGMRFTPATSGTIIGVRFYQGPGNTGTHTGSLWTTGGALLAKVTFPDGTGSGWQAARFSNPVSVTSGTSYVVSYYAPNGNYAADSNYFANKVTNGPLSAPKGNNGLFVYGADAFPTGSYNSTNYWVDPLFVPSGDAPPPPPTALSLFGEEGSPASANWNDSAAITVGVRFQSDISGTVTGVSFYKGPANTGSHVGALWTSDGQLLASGTFANEASSGWVSMTFATPVHITANTTYVASYFAPNGRYAVDINAFSGGYDNGHLHVPAAGGRYHYGGASAFPDSSANHNFWVDLALEPDS
jgi:Domain of unknown function (DUF4082)/Bacterial Ig-like domain/Bacterial Ig domain